MFRSTAILAAILAMPVAGQTSPLTVTGVVRPVIGATVCQQGETHFLECTQVFLRSDTVDLKALEGQNVRITGTDIGVTCPVLQVTAATPAFTFLETCGTASPGCPLKFKVCPGPIGVAWLALSTAPGFAPVHVLYSPVPETILLAEPWVAIPLGFGPSFCFEETIPIPVDLSLVGATFHLQGARMDIGPVGPLQLTNALCLTIGPPGPPCVMPGC